MTYFTQYTYVAANGIISFFLMAKQYSLLYMCHIFFIHSGLEGFVKDWKINEFLKAADDLAKFIFLKNHSNMWGNGLS